MVDMWRYLWKQTFKGQTGSMQCLITFSFLYSKPWHLSNERSMNYGTMIRNALNEAEQKAEENWSKSENSLIMTWLVIDFLCSGTSTGGSLSGCWCIFVVWCQTDKSVVWLSESCSLYSTRYMDGVWMNKKKWLLTVFCGSKSFSRMKTNS